MENKKSRSNALGVALGSVVAGAAIGVAATMLYDKRNQQKIKRVIGDVSQKASKISQQVRKKMDEYGKNLSKSVDKAEDDVSGIKKEVELETQKIIREENRQNSQNN